MIVKSLVVELVQTIEFLLQFSIVPSCFRWVVHDLIELFSELIEEVSEGSLILPTIDLEVVLLVIQTDDIVTITIDGVVEFLPQLDVGAQTIKSFDSLVGGSDTSFRRTSTGTLEDSVADSLSLNSCVDGPLAFLVNELSLPVGTNEVGSQTLVVVGAISIVLERCIVDTKPVGNGYCLLKSHLDVSLFSLLQEHGVALERTRGQRLLHIVQVSELLGGVARVVLREVVHKDRQLTHIESGGQLGLLLIHLTHSLRCAGIPVLIELAFGVLSINTAANHFAGIGGLVGLVLHSSGAGPSADVVGEGGVLEDSL